MLWRIITGYRSRLTQSNSVNSCLQFAYIVQTVLHVALPHKGIMVHSEQSSSYKAIAVELRHIYYIGYYIQLQWLMQIKIYVINYLIDFLFVYIFSATFHL